MENHRFPDLLDGERNRLTYTKKMSHVHFFKHIPVEGEVLDKIQESHKSDKPFLYKGKTYFPQEIGRSDLNGAFKKINTTCGWTTETRRAGVSLVGEVDVDEYKIRLSLRSDHPIRPVVVSAYPVSKSCRYTHRDFFNLDEFERGLRAGRNDRPKKTFVIDVEAPYNI